ncbi:hypothetical protein NG895_05360 [Aeoliella sp. ICT_H6.2]|uniref:Restriction endonuclease type IV Mrr domain-containing protein n=1 Tax=Aeoliella straminimaris TaxID=2954799 RepID=A0A9X2F801_9BACT|nr:hypothetical protein [Aeoliella straminimaris]MCO6043328.1 hypothetical protein [Aeoliella straminimaris]
MAESDPSKRIAPAAIQSLKEALTYAYWYKSDLQSFLTHTVSDSTILARLDWGDYKRNIVAKLVDHLAQNEHIYQRQLLRLMTETANITDFNHLARLDDGAEKVQKAEAAVAALRNQVKGHGDIVAEEKNVERRRAETHQKLMALAAVKEHIEQLKQEYFALLGSDNPQQRGYKLEKILRELFEVFDLDPKASFRIEGEQIDGAFTFEATDYLLEAKWQAEPVSAKHLDGMAGKLSRKLDNTLGLYLSINGFSEDGVKAHSSGRRMLILMDGSDLMAVLEGRIDLIQLLLRKRREASQTGNIYLGIHEILTGKHS